MKHELQNCLTWLANAVAEPVLHTKDPGHLDSDIRQSWGVFCNSAKKYIDWKNLTIEEARELRFRKWDEESDLWLIPIWLYPFIPEDLELTSIGGNKGFAPNIDTDVRFGCLAWGILLKEDSECTSDKT